MVAMERKPTVLNERKPASEEKKDRQRRARRWRKPKLARIRTHVEESKLTDKQRHLLGRQTARLIVAGAMDLRFVGVHFLELYSLGWTPFNGIKCSITEFDGVFEWWHGLAADERAEVLKLSRESGIEFAGKN